MSSINPPLHQLAYAHLGDPNSLYLQESGRPGIFQGELLAPFESLSLDVTQVYSLILLKSTLTICQGDRSPKAAVNSSMLVTHKAKPFLYLPTLINTEPIKYYAHRRRNHFYSHEYDLQLN